MLKERFSEVLIVIKRYFYAISMVLSILFLSIAILIAVLPQIEANKEQNRQETIIKQQLELLEHFALEHKAYDSFLLKRKEEYSKLSTILPNAQQDNNYLAMLQAATQKSGGTLKSANVKLGTIIELPNNREIAKQKKNNRNSLISYEIEVKYMGDYAQLMNFLELMDNNYLNRFSRLKIYNSKGDKLSLEGVFIAYAER